MNSKTFPEKPLQCVPLAEVMNIKINQIFPEKINKQLKHLHPILYELELTLKEQYGIIASKIGELFTDYTLTVLGHTINDSRIMN